ncbi:MAG: PQQ-binding-like beta-propeller repeat protein [Actinomycetes bacterium]
MALVALLVLAAVVTVGVRPDAGGGDDAVVLPRELVPRQPAERAPAAGDVPSGLQPCLQSDAPCSTGSLDTGGLVDARVRADGTVLLLRDQGREVSWVSRSGGTLRSSFTADVDPVEVPADWLGGGHEADGDVVGAALVTPDAIARAGDVEVPPPAAPPPVLVRTTLGGLLGFPADLRGRGWHLPAPRGDRLDVLAVVDDVVLLGRGDAEVRAIDVTDGTTRWVADLDGRLNGPPLRVVALTTDVVALLGPQQVLALDVADGIERWRSPTPGARIVAAGAAGELVLVLDVQVTLTATDLRTGERRWAVPVATSLSNAIDLTGDAGTVVVRLDPSTSRLDRRNVRVLGLDPADGDVRWVHLYATDLPSWPLTLVDGLALQQGTDAPGAVSALDLAGGRLAWSATPGEERAQLLPVGRGLVALAEEEVVRIVVAATGRRTATFSLPPGARVVAAGAGLVIVADGDRLDVVAV